MLNSRLIKFLEHNNLLHNSQNGFRPRRSTEDHIFVLNSVIQNRLHENKDTFIAYIDFAKAFDTVGRPLLYYRLTELGIDGKLFRAFKIMYTKTRSTIRLNDTYFTDYFDTYLGTRQGDTMAPVLFSVLIDSLLRELHNSGIGVDLDGAIYIL